MKRVEELKKKKFLLKYCDKRFYPYIEKVLARIPKDLVDKEINVDSLAIVTTSAACGTYYPFKESAVEHLITLNDSTLEGQELLIVHTIAHELAHKITFRQNAALNEKLAEDLIVEWGFGKE